MSESVKEEIGIKELSELIDGLGELAGFAGAVMKDGKIGADDLVSLVAFGSNFEKISEAVKGAGEALNEAKNLEQDEVLILIGKIYNAVQKFADGKKA